MCQTALLQATESNHEEMVKLLIQWGANPSIVHKVPAPWKCCVHYADDHPHLELEPLFSAVKNNNFYLIKLLLAATPKMPYTALKTLRDILFRTGYTRDARLKPQVIVQYAALFTEVCNKPRLLQEECRGVIREKIVRPTHLSVPKLPLPTKLKDYLLLKDLISGEIKTKSPAKETVCSDWGT